MATNRTISNSAAMKTNMVSRIVSRYYVHIQCDTIMTRSIFFKILKHNRHRIAHPWVRNMGYFFGSTTGMYSVIILDCVIEARMVTSSNGNIFRVTDLLCGEFTGHRWIPLTKASDAEFWCFHWSAQKNGWVKIWYAGDLRCHHVHYDVNVMRGCILCRGIFVRFPRTLSQGNISGFGLIPKLHSSYGPVEQNVYQQCLSSLRFNGKIDFCKQNGLAWYTVLFYESPLKMPLSRATILIQISMCSHITPETKWTTFCRRNAQN